MKMNNYKVCKSGSTFLFNIKETTILKACKKFINENHLKATIEKDSDKQARITLNNNHTIYSDYVIMQS